jgi:hypothetical protein
MLIRFVLRTALVLGAAVLALAAPAAAQYDFTFAPEVHGQVGELNILTPYHTLVTNTGGTTDTYTVVITKSLPGDWIASLCEGSVCYAPFIEQITFTLSPGEETNLDVDITAYTNLGGGSVQVSVTSQGNPSLSVVEDFTLVTPGLDVLLVDADGGAGHEAYYEAALAASGKTWGVWPRDAQALAAGVDLGGFDHVVWCAGPDGPVLDDNDRADLAYYVQHGGSLFLSGADLLHDSCDPASPDYSPMAAFWFNIVTGTQYAADGSAFATATGSASDPVTAGLVLALQGGDGAGGNTSCDVLTASSASVTMLYGAGQVAATRYAYGTGHTFVCGFGLESVASAAERTALLNAFFASINAPTAVPGAGPAAAVGALVAAPNPFNPRTVLSFVVGESADGPVSVDILDVRGRVVRRLFSGALPAGEQSLAWDGRDDDGRSAAAGVYLARVAAGRDAAVSKLVLAK